MELKREAYLLMATIKLLVEGEIRVEHSRLLDRKGKEIKGSASLASMIDEMSKE